MSFYGGTSMGDYNFSNQLPDGAFLQWASTIKDNMQPVRYTAIPLDEVVAKYYPALQEPIA